MATNNGPDVMEFAKEEEKVLLLWQKLDAFKSSLKQSKGRPRYIFYDGPPFATGLPHYGHILAGTVKDIVTRWAHQSGFHVDRRFGWDCHGLPVEYEIDKKLGIKGPEDVMKIGIAQYNNECRKIVMRYSTEWEEIVTRLGRWIDFKNDYKTMYPSFMESIWWVFKELYNKGMVYKGFKVMPFSTACSTPISNFEAGQNYKDVQDPAVIVSFPLLDDPEVKVLAWTTTPWTLPSNLALCVNPQMTYIKVKEKKTGNVYILMEARLVSMFKKEEEYEVLEKFLGATLEGKRYKPIFNYFQHMEKRGAFRILTDGYVTTESGTGVVHQAPYFGEDDYRISLKYKIISRDMDPICPVDMSGRFTAEVKDFVGQYVKDADKNIVKWMKEQGRLVNLSTTTHSYPFCWRSDTPLLYKAVPSWFVRVEQLVPKLLESNKNTRWVPEFVKEKRFANWLKDARDWAISRNRYWGTPIPLWISDDGEEVVCVGSIEELKKLTGNDNITDLHREFVDVLTIPSRCGKGDLHRVSEVFDCWFESGSMPYAQAHYPFENAKEFEDGFPGDFVAEGIDQTRGWFYTLLVLSTALYGKAPFKNLICHGLVLASDGLKMSKRKQNYPDPMSVVNKYGADAVRLYVVNSPVVRAENLKFKEEGVKDILKDVFLPWYNAHRFLLQNIDRLHREEGVQLLYNDECTEWTDNYMDRWVISFTQSLIKFVKEEMAAYRLYTVAPRLVKFFEQLTNWYVRMNRRRMKGDGGREDCLCALKSLFHVLFVIVRIMAPFIPFLTEHMYQKMLPLIDPKSIKGGNMDSVHFLMIPEHREALIDVEIERAVARMQSVIELGRVIRDRATLPSKYPLREVVVISEDAQIREEVKALEKYILEELNVRSMTVTSDRAKYGVHLCAEPDHSVLGARLKGAFKTVMVAVKSLSDADLRQFQKDGKMTVLGHVLTPTDVCLKYTLDASSSSTPSCYNAHSENEILVLLDVTPDQSMLDEGLAREVINRIQRLRKKAKLVPSDDVSVFYKTSGELVRVLVEFSEHIQNSTKSPVIAGQPPASSDIIINEKTKVKTADLELTLVRGSASSPGVTTPGLRGAEGGPAPLCRFVNVELSGGASPQCGATGSQATVLLENPRGDFPLSLPALIHQVQIIFGLQSRRVRLYTSQSKDTEVTAKSTNDVLALHGATLYAFTD